MKILIQYFSILIIGLFTMGFKSTTLESSFELTVQVISLRNNTGVVQFALYNQAGTIPDENYDKYYQIKRALIKENSAVIVFDNLPKGDYAVNVLHDENQDGQIEMGWIKPKEGIGFSIFDTINPLDRPRFEKAKIELNTDIMIDVKIIYL